MLLKSNQIEEFHQEDHERQWPSEAMAGHVITLRMEVRVREVRPIPPFFNQRQAHSVVKRHLHHLIHPRLQCLGRLTLILLGAT